MEPPFTSERPRVLFFDCWTKGAEKFARIVNAASQRKGDYWLFHYGSFYDPATPHTEVACGLQCVDIALFRGMDLEEIIKSLHPDVVVGLNVASVFDRTMYLSCARLGIPTVFVQHGSWPDRDNFEGFLRSLDDGFTLMDRLRRVPKFLKLFPWYIRARSSSALDLDVWRVFWRLLQSPTISHFFPTAPEELWPTLAMTYTEDVADRLAESHRLPRERLRVVGNPELDPVVARRATPLDRTRRCELIESQRLDPETPIVCYVEDGFVEQQNCFGWTEARRLDLIRELYLACRSVGVQLMIRPHPITDVKPMQAELNREAGVVVTRSMSLLDMVDISNAALGTLSTALETAVVLGKPLLVPLWHFNGQRSISPYLRYGAAIPLESRSDLLHALALVPGGLPVTDTSHFIARRLGPLDGLAAQRIASAILKLACRHMSVC